MTGILQVENMGHSSEVRLLNLSFCNPVWILNEFSLACQSTKIGPDSSDKKNKKIN